MPQDSPFYLRSRAAELSRLADRARHGAAARELRAMAVRCLTLARELEHGRTAPPCHPSRAATLAACGDC